MSTVFLFCFFLCLNSALSLNVPQHHCPHFEYGSDGVSYFAVITAPKGGDTNFYWRVHFSIQGENQDPADRIEPYPSSSEVMANIQIGKPVQMVVRFKNIENDLPMLTLLELNGEALCINPGYPAPATKVKLGQRMFAGVGPRNNIN